MKHLKFSCSDREYKEWSIYDANNLTKLNNDDYTINPIQNKLFNQDIFLVDETNTFVKIIHSSNREMPVIPAVLYLDKSYGSVKKKKNAYYYKAVPDDKRLPSFLVPYKIKNTSFMKKKHKKYIIIKYNDWHTKHPTATIIQTIGNVEVLSNFYEYQLYCKSLYSSIQGFTKSTMDKLKQTSEDEYIERIMNDTKYNIQDRRDWDVICIDPVSSKDFDDGFSIYHINDIKNRNLQYNVLNNFHNYDKTIEDSYILSIYISNVSIWMDALNLWNSFSQRIATIYLPDRKRPMLPSILSDSLCSLQEKQTRFAFTLDLLIQNNDIKEYNFVNTAIKVKKNYRYSDTSLKEEPIYITTFSVIKKLKQQFNSYMTKRLNDSHDLVGFLMVLMNYICAKEFQRFGCGIFRSIKLDLIQNIPDNLPDDFYSFLKMWNSTGGQYLKYDEKGENTAHDILKFDAYVHITSPIRRLVDLLNMVQLQDCLNIQVFSNESKLFYEKWISNKSIDYINTTMRAIRKLQNNCQLLDLCVNHPSILEKSYIGYVFDKIQRNDKLFQYLVYIPELKLLNKFTTRYEKENYSTDYYKLYLFQDEETFKQKILIGLDN